MGEYYNKKSLNILGNWFLPTSPSLKGKVMYNEFHIFPQNIIFFIRGIYSWIFQPPWGEGEFFKPISLEKRIKEMLNVTCLFWRHITNIHAYCYNNLSNNIRLSSPPLSLYFLNVCFPAYYLHSFIFSLQNVDFYV